jgi:Tfp pilus assembly protein PilP
VADRIEEARAEARAAIDVIRSIRDSVDSVLDDDDVPEPFRSELAAKVADYKAKNDALIREIEEAIARG